MVSNVVRTEGDESLQWAPIDIRNFVSCGTVSLERVIEIQRHSGAGDNAGCPDFSWTLRRTHVVVPYKRPQRRSHRELKQHCRTGPAFHSSAFALQSDHSYPVPVCSFCLSKVPRRLWLWNMQIVSPRPRATSRSPFWSSQVMIVVELCTLVQVTHLIVFQFASVCVCVCVCVCVSRSGWQSVR